MESWAEQPRGVPRIPGFNLLQSTPPSPRDPSKFWQEKSKYWIHPGHFYPAEDDYSPVKTQSQTSLCRNSLGKIHSQFIQSPPAAEFRRGSSSRYFWERKIPLSAKKKGRKVKKFLTEEPGNFIPLGMDLSAKMLGNKWNYWEIPIARLVTLLKMLEEKSGRTFQTLGKGKSKKSNQKPP